MSISSCCEGAGCLNWTRHVFEPLIVKITTLVTFLLFVVTITVGCLHVNAIATYTLLGFSFLSLVTNCLCACLCRRQREEITEFIELENTTEDLPHMNGEEATSPSENQTTALESTHSGQPPVETPQEEIQNIPPSSLINAVRGDPSSTEEEDGLFPIPEENEEGSTSSSQELQDASPVQNPLITSFITFSNGETLPIAEPSEEQIEDAPENSFDCSEPEDVALEEGNVQIERGSQQLELFKRLTRGSDSSGHPHSSCFEIGSYNEVCDQYRTGFPSNSARLFLSDGTATNGASLWGGKLILIQGPHTAIQIKHLWSLAIEKEAGAIVRLGPILGYRNYCPQKKPLHIEGITIGCAETPSQTLFHETTCIHYPLEYQTQRRMFPVYAIKGWQDFKTNHIEEIYHLIRELDRLQGPLIIHCRGGFGRTGTFAVCWKIYQLYKEANESGQRPLVINPCNIIDEMRLARCSTVQTEEQFLMIIGFIDYLKKI